MSEAMIDIEKERRAYLEWELCRTASNLADPFQSIAWSAWLARAQLQASQESALCESIDAALSDLDPTIHTGEAP